MTKSVILVFVIIIMVLLIAAVGLALYALKLHREQCEELQTLRRKVRAYEKEKNYR